MFDKIQLAGLDKSEMFKYAKDVDWFKGRTSIEFKPGLNILLGPNGSGKSTVLKMLASSMCAKQGGVSTVTENVISSEIDMMSAIGARLRDSKKPRSGMVDKLGLSISHDGQPVIFCDPRQAVGLMGSSFDDDFMQKGIIEALSENKRSHGELALQRANGALAVLWGKAPFPKKISYSVSRSNINDVWKSALTELEKRFKPSIPKGQSTVLLDEPEANYSLLWQARLWEVLANPEVAKRFQVIIASHSAFALGIEHANYIDLVPGFRQEAEDVLRRRFAAS